MTICPVRFDPEWFEFQRASIEFQGIRKIGKFERGPGLEQMAGQLMSGKVSRELDRFGDGVEVEAGA